MRLEEPGGHLRDLPVSCPVSTLHFLFFAPLDLQPLVGEDAGSR